MTDETLKPCPFCGSSDVHIFDTGRRNRADNFIIRHNCEYMEGPLHTNYERRYCDETDAAADWNKRSVS